MHGGILIRWSSFRGVVSSSCNLKRTGSGLLFVHSCLGFRFLFLSISWHVAKGELKFRIVKNISVSIVCERNIVI